MQRFLPAPAICLGTWMAKPDRLLGIDRGRFAGCPSQKHPRDFARRLSLRGRANWRRGWD